MARILEICVDDLAGLEAAVAGGADRIEVCSALSVGGLTPSPAFVAVAVTTGLPVHAMVRPRPGDFRYRPGELALMARDIAMLAAMGVAGFVVGAARADGSIDRDALRGLRLAAPRCHAVLHRAIDLAPDPCAAIEDAAAAGFDYVLSSGGHATAPAGAAMLKRMVAIAGERLVVVGGSGVTAGNVAALIATTGLCQVHASASLPGSWSDERIEQWGFAAGLPRLTSATQVTALKQAIGAA